MVFARSHSMSSLLTRAVPCTYVSQGDSDTFSVFGGSGEAEQLEMMKSNTVSSIVRGVLAERVWGSLLGRRCYLFLS